MQWNSCCVRVCMCVGYDSGIAVDDEKCGVFWNDGSHIRRMSLTVARINHLMQTSTLPLIFR